MMKRFFNYSGRTSHLSKFNSVIQMVIDSPIPCCGPWNAYVALSMRPHTHLMWEHRTVPCSRHEGPSLGSIHLSNPSLNSVSLRLKRSIPYLGKLGKAGIWKQGYVSQQLMADVAERQKEQSLERRRVTRQAKLSLSTKEWSWRNEVTYSGLRPHS